EDSTPATVTFRINTQITPQMIDSQSFVLQDGSRIFIDNITLNEGGKAGSGDMVTFSLFYCGDSTCEISESCLRCSLDCDCQAGHDCRAYNPPACFLTVCGDYWCSTGETCALDSCCKGNRVDFERDRNNCGACGNVCPDDQICLNSVCQRQPPDQCSSDADCDDNNACTTDVCEETIPRTCTHIPLPYCGISYASYGGSFELEPRGNDEYTLEFTNRYDTFYQISYLTNEGSTFKYGDTDKDLVFIEANFSESMTSEDVQRTENLFNIGILDYFILSSLNDSAGDTTNAISQVLRYNSIDISAHTLSFDEEASGTQEFTYEDFTLSNGAVLGKAYLHFGTNRYVVYIANATSAGDDNPLAIDMNGDGLIDRAEIKLTNKASGVMDLGYAEESDGGNFTYNDGNNWQCVTAFCWSNAGDLIASDTSPLSLITQQRMYHNAPSQDEVVVALFEKRPSNQLGILFVNGSNFQMQNQQTGTFITDYGLSFNLELPLPCCGAETLFVSYLPEIQFSNHAEIGHSINITITDPASISTPYILLMALGTEPGYVLEDGRIIPLNSTNQSVLHESLVIPEKVGLFNSYGTLDANGQATATLNIPNIPELEDYVVSFAFITMDYKKPIPEGILYISSPESITLDY
ncbi:MAG: hypothetical protein Q8L34_00740, partial [Candidatus Woesearchaeota archaeon]|nr:hypothetical protein [Candidatus Woesearchaeota archaeon]